MKVSACRSSSTKASARSRPGARVYCGRNRSAFHDSCSDNDRNRTTCKHSPARQLSIFDPMRSLRGGAEPGLPIRLVFRVVAIEPKSLAVPFEGENVGGDTVEKPAIV